MPIDRDGLRGLLVERVGQDRGDRNLGGYVPTAGIRTGAVYEHRRTVSSPMAGIHGGAKDIGHPDPDSR